MNRCTLFLLLLLIMHFFRHIFECRCATVQSHFVDIVLCRIHKHRRWFLGHSVSQLHSVCVWFVQRTVTISNVRTNPHGRVFIFTIWSNVSAHVHISLDCRTHAIKIFHSPTDHRNRPLFLLKPIILHHTRWDYNNRLMVDLPTYMIVQAKIIYFPYVEIWHKLYSYRSRRRKNNKITE